MGGGKGKKAATNRPKVQFRVVQQSYEDKDYEAAPKPVLVPAVQRRRPPPQPVCRFDEDALPDDFTEKRNMLMQSDLNPEEMQGDDDVGLFNEEGEFEEEFDETFVKELMYGDAPGDEQPEEVEEEEYPKHTTRGAMEKQFEALIREFNIDAALDEEDPRAHGQLDVEDYAPALEAFVAEHAGNNLVSELPMRHRGLLNQLKMMSRGHAVFDSNGKGNFLLSVLGEKTSRRVEDFFSDTEALRRQTLEQLKTGKLQPSAMHVDPAGAAAATGPDGAPLSTDAEVKMVTMEVKKSRGERQLDCMTAYSTSTRYNHPNVIVPASSENRIKLSLKAAHRKSKEQQAEAAVAASSVPARGPAVDMAGGDIRPGQRRAAVAAAANTQEVSATRKSAAAAVDSDGGDDDGDDHSSLGAPVDEQLVDLSYRPKDETPEEKALRRKMVKELQAARRLEKKMTKGAYKTAEIVQKVGSQRSKQEKGQIPLSVVRGTVPIA